MISTPYVSDLRPIHPPMSIPSDIHKLTSFITFYPPSSPSPKYLSKVPLIRISLNDIFVYDQQLGSDILSNTFTYVSLIHGIYDRIFYDDSSIDYLSPDSTISLLMYHRLARLKEKYPDKRATDVFPGELLRDYECYFVIDETHVKQIIESHYMNTILNITNTTTSIPFLGLRQLNSFYLGKYVLARGIVTRITPTRPVLTLATYICETCGSETYQPVDPTSTHNTTAGSSTLPSTIPHTADEPAKKPLVYDNMHTIASSSTLPNVSTFKMLSKCDSPKCRLLSNPPTLTFQPRTSKFTVSQSLVVSELCGDVPGSCTPLTMCVVVRGCGVVDRVRVGDSVVVGGVYCLVGKVGGVRAHEIYDYKGNVFVKNNMSNVPVLQSLNHENEQTKEFNNLNVLQSLNHENEQTREFNNLNVLQSLNHGNEQTSEFNNHNVLQSLNHENEQTREFNNNLNTSKPLNHENKQTSEFNNNVDTRTHSNFMKNDMSITSLNNIIKNRILPNSFPYIPDILIDSFAPEIYNYRDTKHILLLALTGSYQKIKSEMKIRGTINILLVGDPGTAKSQMLKTINKISSRGIYITGKGTTGVGMTASLSREITGEQKGEFVLEAGALVLSDMGICCIDEIDKMDDNDRVAIHEVMEQQSISISKAGINTTLNARCSIVAAGNPVRKGGKYDRTKSVEWNVGMGVALVSRFDCVVVMEDIVDVERDTEMARHITKGFLAAGMDGDKENAGLLNYDQVRDYIEMSKTTITNDEKEKENSGLLTYDQVRDRDEISKTTFTSNEKDKENSGLLTYDQMRDYIEMAKTIMPVLEPSLGKKLIDTYIEKRKENERITPRYLLSLIRLSIANARLRLSKKVENYDVDEAIRLISTTYLNPNKKNNEEKDTPRNIYEIIIKMSNEDGCVEISKIMEKCAKMGIAKDEVESAINVYVDCGAVLMDGSKIKILK